MTAILFGIPPTIQPSVLLSACKDVETIHRVAVERLVPQGRTVRWVVLRSSERHDATDVLAALVKAAHQVVVAVADDEDDEDTWRVFGLTSKRGRLHYLFDDFGAGLRRRGQELSMKQRLAERTSRADVADVRDRDVPHTFGTDSWEYFVRADGGTSSFAAGEASSFAARELSGNVHDDAFDDGSDGFFGALYGWDTERDDDDDPPGSPAQAPQPSQDPTKAEILARIRSGTLKAERLLQPQPRRTPAEGPSRKKPGSAD